MELPDPRETWFGKYARVQSTSDAAIRKILATAASAAAQSAKDADLRPGIGAQVRAAQYRLAEGSIRMILAEMWASIHDRIASDREGAVAAAVRAAMSWDAVLLGLTGLKRSLIRNSMESAAERNVRLLLQRYETTHTPLSTRVYRSKALADGWVHNRINVAIAKGDNARELAAAVKGLIRPDTPGGVGYAAKRLARTEINASYHYASVTENEEKPYVNGMDWKLSRSHHEIDVCDEVALRSPYKKGHVPTKEDTHPQCMCYIVPLVEDEDDFVKNFKAGKYDNYLNEKYNLKSKPGGAA